MANAITVTVAVIAMSAFGSEPSQGSRSASQGAQSAGGADGTTSGPFVTSTLPSTGHATRFKRYPEAGMTGQSAMGKYGGSVAGAGINSGALSPYLNFARGGSTLNNYLSFQRDQTIYSTGAQTQQISSQLRQMSETRPTRSPTQPIVENIDTTPTPLERRFQRQKQEQGDVSTANAEQLTLLREILRELKAIRESSAPARPEQKPEDQ